MSSAAERDSEDCLQPTRTLHHGVFQCAGSLNHWGFKIIWKKAKTVFLEKKTFLSTSQDSEALIWIKI